MNDIQIVILDIYKQIIKICNKHEIPVFAIGGTCLGAVRHKGFIPWDDDLDIAIPIQDYNRFWNIAKNELPDNLKVFICDDVLEYRYIFGKIHNIDTTFIEKSDVGFPRSYKGIFVDVMPLGSVPQDESSRKKFYSKINLYYKLNFIRRYPYKAMDSFKKRLLWIVMRSSGWFIKNDYYSKKWLSMLQDYPLGSTNLAGYTWSTQVERLTFPMSDFESTIDMQFEDTYIKCPVGYDHYLKQQFGDYMQVPPIEDRAPHSIELINTEVSYRKYQKEIYK